MKQQKLTKEMRLCGRKAVGRLFKECQSMYVYPIKVIFIRHTEEEATNLRVLFSASRRNFKLAVERNLIKRRLHEGWRKVLAAASETDSEQLTKMDVGLIFTGKSLSDSKEMEHKIKQILQRLSTFKYEADFTNPG